MTAMHVAMTVMISVVGASEDVETGDEYALVVNGCGGDGDAVVVVGRQRDWKGGGVSGRGDAKGPGGR